ncbi:MAG: GTP 3',8-cyclase MoaA [Gammaproteobacteria bacterium TMED78]|nr:MAG: GTP 3',8-cyclase MoaA [Gammaproteobacteria bacterium TMED78]
MTDKFSRPLRDLRISVIDRCNFRCPYCMPSDKYGKNHQFMPKKDWLSAGEIKRIAQLFMQLGVEKVRLTGGEPLLRKDILDIVSNLSSLPNLNDLALTTNGSFLADKAKDLKALGLDRITISLDSIDKGIFREMSGGKGNLDNVLNGIEVARKVGLGPIKLNVVIQKEVNDSSVLDLLDYFRGTGVIVRFIEFMDVGTLNNWKLDHVVSSADLLEIISRKWKLVPVKKNYFGEVARRYSYQDGQGEIGFISSVSKPFCGDCNRARISADGTIYTCLFASKGMNIRNFMRSGSTDNDLMNILQKQWRERVDRYSELRKDVVKKKKLSRIEMYTMGG